MTDPVESAGNALQTVETMIAEEIDTAATDIANTNDHQEDIEAHDLGLAPHADHKLHRALYNGAALCLHSPTRFQANWSSPVMHLHPRR
jgi:hypothetical protein